MLHEFTLSRGRAMINFTLKYCDTKQKLLSSYGFRRVVEAFVKKIKKDDPIIYDHYIKSFKTDENLVESLIESFKLLTVFKIEEVIEVDNKYTALFADKDLFIELIELLLQYWKKL